MSKLRRWKIDRRWHSLWEVIWLDCGSNSVPNAASALDLPEKRCFQASLKLLCEADSTQLLGSNHCGEEGGGLYALKCQKARTYWCYHLGRICLLHVVKEGKTRQAKDLVEARARQAEALKLFEIED